MDLRLSRGLFVAVLAASASVGLARAQSPVPPDKRCSCAPTKTSSARSVQVFKVFQDAEGAHIGLDSLRSTLPSRKAF